MKEISYKYLSYNNSVSYIILDYNVLNIPELCSVFPWQCHTGRDSVPRYPDSRFHTSYR